MSKIDVVLTWVDGADPEWLKEKSKHTGEKYDDDNINRYRDWGLLKYWFRSLEKFAPWVNKIHFITWGHLPDWLNTENEKLNIVNHRDYIPEKYLPVFSSHPIELNMWRIDSLSEQFIYLNDDVYLINSVSPEDFFCGGLPVDNVTEVPLRFNEGGIDHIIGNNMMVINKHFNKREVVRKNRKQWFSPSAPVSAFKNMYMLPINGFSAFDNPHLSFSFLKSTMKELWEKEYELFDNTCSHRFRSNEDVNPWLFRYWQFATGNFVQSKGLSGRIFSIGDHDAEIEKAMTEQHYQAICLSDNDTELDFSKEQKFLEELFHKILPKKSSFEK